MAIVTLFIALIYYLMSKYSGYVILGVILFFVVGKLIEYISSAICDRDGLEKYKNAEEEKLISNLMMIFTFMIAVLLFEATESIGVLIITIIIGLVFLLPYIKYVCRRENKERNLSIVNDLAKKESRINKGLLLTMLLSDDNSNPKKSKYKAYEPWNFEEEDLEEDDFYFEDDL